LFLPVFGDVPGVNTNGIITRVSNLFKILIKILNNKSIFPGRPVRVNIDILYAGEQKTGFVKASLKKRKQNLLHSLKQGY
jgi:hypothetical protein